MLLEPMCCKRKCIHFLGIKRLGVEEETEVVYCKAFPEGIPDNVAYGNNEHLKVISEQIGDFIYLRDTNVESEPETIYLKHVDSGSRFTDDHMSVYSPNGKLKLDIS